MPIEEHAQPDTVAASAQQLAEAVRHHQAGHAADAERFYRAAIELSPLNGNALRLLGALYLQTGQSAQALASLRNAIALQPGNPEIYNNLGVASRNLGKTEEAINYFRQALSIDPIYADALDNLGKALCAEGDFRNAIDCFEKLVPMRIADFGTLIDMGRCYYEMNRLQESIACFESAYAQNPKSADALGGLGASLWAVGDFDNARNKLEEALRLKPSNPTITLNIGELLYGQGKISEALEYFNQALIYKADFPVALWRKSFTLLALGQYREGWKLYAESLGHKDLRGPNLFTPLKPWDGTPAPNKHLLIWGEQGLGDVMQFIRYAELCKERVGKVSIFCQRPLVQLLSALPFIDHVSDTCDRNNFDEHIPVMSLPHIFDTVVEAIPAAVPYLHVAPEIQAKWAAKFEDKGDDLKVGLVWVGGSHKNNVRNVLMDRQRSIKLEQLEPWFHLSGIQFYSLQKDAQSGQIAALSLENYIKDFMPEVSDFADTAAIIQNLDLVVTVDTSVAHLAGGLGKPVWVMSRYNADWRWLQNRPTNPWYPTARVFGQPTMGDWDSVISQIGHELASY